MSRHEANLEQCLDRYEKDALKKVMATWFHFPPNLDARKCFRAMKDLKPDMSIEDVIEIALSFDNCLVDFYKRLTETSASEDVRDLFQNLLERVQEEAARKLVGC